jgi:hypothetical protein
MDDAAAVEMLNSKHDFGKVFLCPVFRKGAEDLDE